MSKNQKLTNQEVARIFKDNAVNTAQSICGTGNCICCFKCGHTNKSGYTIGQYGKGDSCPLEKYNIQPDTRTFKELIEAGVYNPDPEEQMNGMFAVCACCEHSGVVVKNGYYELARTDEEFEAYCMDCPINMALETLQEGMAEAAMS